MIWIGLIMIVAGIVLLVAGRSARNTQSKVAGGIVSVLGVAAMSVSMITIIPAGHVGVPVLFGSVADRSLEQGLRLKNPFANVILFSVRVQTYDMTTSLESSDSTRSLSSDGMQMPLDVTVHFSLNGPNAPSVYEHIGINYQSSIIRSVTRTAIREAVSKFTSQEAYSTRREELALNIEERLEERLQGLLVKKGINGEAIQVQQVLLRNVDLPDTVKRAIEDKLAAEQESLKMTFVLERERQEAERKRIEAAGIKDFQDIVSAGIDEKLLKWKGIEATHSLASSSNTKVIVIGGTDGLPLIMNTQ